MDSLSTLDRDVAGPLLSWWDGHARDLPWRDTRDPWAVLVSEVMAQQTGLERVVPAWYAFLERFPTVHDAAAAPVGALVDSWAGLGYNRRAVHLHAAAREIVDRYGGHVPASVAGLMSLPGIGPYTARAVMAFAFEGDVGVVDTNVGRVLARLSGRALPPAEAQELADSLVPAGDGWRWNQALLDFGATLCTRRGPGCDRCPLEHRCRWAGVGADPAVGSAGVSGGQSPFTGSDREGRGRLVATLRRRSVADGELAEVMGWPSDPERAGRVAAGVVADGLAVHGSGVYRLPD